MPAFATSQARGFTLVELIVTAALIALVFGGIMAAVQFSLKLISHNKAATGALALANERIEYVRSLPYATVGTIAGIPSGPLNQNSTTTLNGALYHERILVEYVDSPDDGQGAADTNSILADYKRIKVEYSWWGQTGTSSLFLLTNMVPPGIESTAGGGTLIVNVFNEAVAPVSNASVRLVNNTTTSTIDVTRFTDISGIAIFAGAPAAANYQITATRANYSTDQTYSASSSNPNPITPHVAVLAGAVSTMNFQIDSLSDLTLRTVGVPTMSSFTDNFDDGTLMGSLTDTVISGGGLLLAGAPGSYAVTGTAYATTTTPATIDAWDTMSWASNTGTSTTIAVHLYELTATGSLALVPDAFVPGNAAGFTTGPVNISGVVPGTYPSLVIGATLSSSDVNETPEILDWSLTYRISEPAIPDIAFMLTGNKTIGTTATASPVYKYRRSHTTDGSGEIDIQDLEWDVYNVALSGGAYDIKEACSGLPYTLDPGVTDTLRLVLTAATAYSLRVSVVDATGNPITGANVDLTRAGYSGSDTSSTCGQVFFNSGLGAYSDYVLAVDAMGYASQTITDVNIQGTDSISVTLVP